MTRKLYDTDSHIQVFEAEVMSCQAAKKGYAIELDQTAFFAEGGGQKADRGYLEGQTVLDVQEKDGHIYHYVAEPMTVGSRVQGQIDWPFRFTNMQQHSGEHILSGIAYAWKGYHNVGFHMNDSVTTIDFDGPLTEEEVQELELRANRVIYANQPITIEYPSAEELAALDYRSKKELSGAVRIVRLGDADCCACCAPHVKLTGEIGMVKIVAAEHYKGGMRLTIVCGERALEDFKRRARALKQIGSQLSAKPEKAAEAVEKLSQEASNLKLRVAALSSELVQLKIDQCPVMSSICLYEPGLDAIAARNLVNGLAEKMKKYAIVLLPKAKNEYLYIMGSRTEDVRLVEKALAEQFECRGGGSAQMVQGTVKGDLKAIGTFLV